MTDATETSSFRIDLDNLCLWRSGGAGPDERLSLTPKTFDVLRYLAENTGRLVTHDELLTALWPDIHVQPEVLKSHILAVRTALGDDSSSPTFIETQRGRGYRFIGQMAGFAPPDATPEAPLLDLGVFAGRAEPMRGLLKLYEQVSSGQFCAVFISGEPGIGKTTLIEQFLLRVRGPAGLVEARGHCIEGFAGAEPYYPIFEALRELSKTADRNRVVRALQALAPSWASQMPDQISAGQRTALHEPALPDARPRMIREACNVFETIATERPLVLVLEDLHWADFATIDFISALCRRRSQAKLLLIGTYRPEDLQTARHPLKQITADLALRKYCREIELTPLSDGAITELLTGDATGEAGSSEFIEFIEAHTGGNPLFMRIALEYLLERGDIARTADGWRPLVPVHKLASKTPPTLARMIETKIEGMTDEQRRVLEAASVAGNDFDPITAAPAAVMDEQSFEAVCESFTSGIIRRDKLLTLPNNQLVRTYNFNHAAYRHVIYDRIGQVRLAYLHRTIGERLEEIYPADQRSDLAVRLAQHFAFARDWARALDYLRSALRVANSRSARRDALAILDRAVALTANLAESARIPAEIEFLERRAAIEAAGHDPKALESYALLAERAAQSGDIDARCRALAGLSYALSWHDLRRSLEVVDQILALCEKLADPIQQDLTRITAYVRRLWGSGWNRDDAQRCEEALGRLRHHGEPLAVALAQANFAMLCMVSTRYRETRDFVTESYRVLNETSRNLVEADVARVVWMRHIGVPWALFSLGEFGAARAEFDAGIAAFESNGDVSAARSLRTYRCVLLFQALDFEGVLEGCAPVVGAIADQGIRVLPVERRIALLFSGLAEAGLGNNTVALGHLRAAEDEMERQPVHLDWYWRLALEWGMVNLLIAQGNYAGALERANQLCALAMQTDERTWQALAWEARARAALSCDESSEAADSVANALTACEGATVPLAEWRVHATCAVAYKAVGDVQRAERHIELGSTVGGRLAESLPENDPVRLKFEQRSELFFAS